MSTGPNAPTGWSTGSARCCVSACRPLRPEVVAVRQRAWSAGWTKGSRTCSAFHPGQQDGVCANVRFPHPSTLVAQALASAAGIDPDNDSWDPEVMLSSLLEPIDECAPEA
jgi:exodeoxyribonuclease V gamma subunit